MHGEPQEAQKLNILSNQTVISNTQILVLG